MFDDKTLGARSLANPSIMQGIILTELQNRLGGTYVAADPNNPFCFQLEASSSGTAQFVRQSEAKFNGLYEKRAETSDELYGHMSDYDYVDLMAQPAPCSFCLLLSADWVKANAVAINTSYQKLTIPASSVIQLGTRYFGLYYPIDIIVNTNTGDIAASFDTTVANPLHTLQSNMLPETLVYTQNGYSFLKLVFTAYQFRISQDIDNLSNIGYSKVFTYTDKFYNARVFTRATNTDAWTELEYSLSKTVYDPSVATVLLTLLEDNQSVRVQVPQVYFTTGLMGTQIRVDLYTTEGALDVAISPVDSDSSNCKIAISQEDVYSAAFSDYPFAEIVPYNQIKLEGGSDPIDFATFRQRLITGALYDSVPVTRAQLYAKAADLGYSLQVFRDGLLDRIYFAYRLLTSTAGRIAPCGVIGIRMRNDALKGDPSTILAYTDGLFTILPTTLFKYNSANNSCDPLSDADVTSLSKMTNAQLATELNTNTYLRQPYHLVLDSNDKYPQAKTYDMTSPTCDVVTIIGENAGSTAMMSVDNGGIAVAHNANGTGGFTIRLGVKTTATAAKFDKTKLKVVLLAQTRSGNTVYTEAEYVGSTDTLDIWDALIPTTYHLSIDGYLQTILTSPTGGTVTSEIAISSVFDIRLMVDKSLVTDVDNEDVLTTGLPQSYIDSYLVMARQNATLTFAKDLSTGMYNVVTPTWGSEAYATYPENIYHTYPADVHQKTSSGVISTRVVTADDGTKSLETVTLYKANTTVPSKKVIEGTVLGTVSSGSLSLTLQDASLFKVGLVLTGIGLSTRCRIDAIDGNVLTLSTQTTAVIPDGTVVSVPNSDPTTTIATAQTAVGNTLVVTDLSGIGVGMIAYGFGLGDATATSPLTVTQVDPTTNTVTLSGPSTEILTQGVYVTFVNPTSPGYIKYTEGSTKLDASGNPIVMLDRQNEYLVQAILFDARLYASSATEDQTFISTLPSLISSYTNAIIDFASTLWGETQVYFRPTRTIGTATYNTGGGASVTLSLAVSATITLYVSQGAYNNASLKTVMESTAIAFYTAGVQADTISAFDIETQLKAAFGDYLVSAVVSGIDNDNTLKAVSISDAGAIPSVERYLDVNTDGSLYLKDNITVSILLAPKKKTDIQS